MRGHVRHSLATRETEKKFGVAALGSWHGALKLDFPVSTLLSNRINAHDFYTHRCIKFVINMWIIHKQFIQRILPLKNSIIMAAISDIYLYDPSYISGWQNLSVLRNFWIEIYLKFCHFPSENPYILWWCSFGSIKQLACKKAMYSVAEVSPASADRKRTTCNWPLKVLFDLSS